jgi:POT family proton-dependent oligopeptide transporter
VKLSPQGNNLPTATKTSLFAAKSGFKMNNAKASYQYIHYGKRVPWNDQFVDEMKRRLLAYRVMLVLLTYPQPPIFTY